jgi:Flp pilus assembly protein TadG
MRSVKSQVIRRFANWIQNERGAVTVDGILWVPVYGLFFALIVDTSLMFNGQSQAQRVIQDVNRLASWGYYRTETEVEDRSRAVLAHLTTNATIETTIDTANGTITTFASIPAADLMAIGMIARFANIQVTVGAAHAIEG